MKVFRSDDPQEPGREVTLAMMLPEAPSANRWHRYRRGQRTPYKAPNVRAYQQAVAALVRQHLQKLGVTEFPVFKGATGRGKTRIAAERVELEIVWWRTAERGDLDKRVGILLDALQGTVYANDKQVRKFTAEVRDEPQRQTGLWLVVA